MLRAQSPNMKSIPNLLLIGAAKAGTSTLASDLAGTGEIYLPDCKEPHCLTDGVDSDSILEKYQKFFDEGKNYPWRLDASTGYAMRDRNANVPAKAKKIFGKDIPIIYLVREPVARCISHHFHLFRNNGAPASFGESIKKFPELIEFGKYAYQLEPWLAEFDRSNFTIVVFEEYMADRQAGLKRLLNELGIEASEKAEFSRPSNTGVEMPSPKGWSRSLVTKVMESDFYKSQRTNPVVKKIRDISRLLLMRKSVAPPKPPCDEERSLVIESTRSDCHEFFKILGREIDSWSDFVRPGVSFNENGSVEG